jgi:hypothetical protein
MRGTVRIDDGELKVQPGGWPPAPIDWCGPTASSGSTSSV